MAPRTPDHDARAAFLLLASIAVTVLLYVVPYGHTIGYPLVLVSTVAHEMGHGIAAMIAGAGFEKLVIHSDASGFARHGHAGRLATGFIAAGGLVGPAVAAAFGFAFGRRPGAARWFVLALGAFFALSVVFYVRNLFGVFFVGALAAALVYVGVRGRPAVAQLVLVFLSVQLALSVFSRGDYLFTDSAHTADGVFPSDVANMSSALLLPYWFWGALCGAFSIVVLVAGTWLFVRGARRKPARA